MSAAPTQIERASEHLARWQSLSIGKAYFWKQIEPNPMPPRFHSYVDDNEDEGEVTRVTPVWRLTNALGDVIKDGVDPVKTLPDLQQELIATNVLPGDACLYFERDLTDVHKQSIRELWGDREGGEQALKDLMTMVRSDQVNLSLIARGMMACSNALANKYNVSKQAMIAEDHHGSLLFNHLSLTGVYVEYEYDKDGVHPSTWFLRLSSDEGCLSLERCVHESGDPALPPTLFSLLDEADVQVDDHWLSFRQDGEQERSSALSPA